MQLFESLDHATQLVNTLNATEDACGWTYRAVEHANGKASILVFDEDGNDLGAL